ncbi:MAG: DUF4442 domain-containing protein [Gammaproteobacteria bacterium]
MNLSAYPKLFRFGLNVWPPFLGAGISVTRISTDWREVEVASRLRWRNRNYVGTHFGGNLFMMTDPFYMLMLMHNLGSAYRVWDRSSCIDFLAPGRGTVTASFALDEALLEDIRTRTAGGEKHLRELTADIRDEAGATIAAVRKVLYIRKKKPSEFAPAAREV